MKGLKKWTVGLLSAAMLFSAVPAAFSQLTAPVEGQVTADKDFVRDQSGAPLKNEDGSYTIQLSVQGVPYEELQNANADVVLVVDNSGSMASSVGEKCTTTKDQFQEKSRETVLLAWTAITYECPNCHANYTRVIGNLSGETWYENIPNVCTGEKGNEARIDTAKAVGKEFADKLLLTDGQATGNRLAVIGFASEQRDGGANDAGAIKVKQALTVDLTAINTAIDKMKANGGTNYSAALQQAVTWLNSRTGEDAKRPAYVIFVSDGAPGRSGESINDSNWNGSTQVTALKNNNVTIYTVGIALDDAASQYLKSLASVAQDDHYINVTSTNYKEELQKKLGEWATQIKSIPAGKNAVMTDVINIADFDLMTTSLPEGVVLGTDGKTLTWNIGDIPETAKTIAFQVKPKDGKYGELFTNETVSLTYQDSKTNQGVEVGRDAIENPRLSVTVPHPQTTHTLTYDANGGVWEGTFNGVDSQTVAAGSYEFTVKDNVPTKDGYDFLGWADQATATAGQYAAGAKITVSGNKTIYAVWGNPPTPMVQTIHVNFVDADESTSLQQNDIKSTDPATTLLTPPTVTAPAGKEFAGWKVLVGTQPIYTGAYSFTSLCALVGDNWTAEGEAWLTFAATYQDATQEEQVITVKFDANGGTWTDSVPATSLKEFVLRSTTATAELNAPAVQAPAGKEFVRWEMQEGAMLLDAEAVFTYNSVVPYVVNDNTNFTFKAVFQDVVSQDKTLRIFWAIDNPDGAIFTNNNSATPWTETIAWSDKENTFVIPALTIAEGYRLAGWTVSGAQANYWDADTETFGLTGLIVEDENGGYVSITANVVADQGGEEPAGKIHVNFYIANENGGDYTVDGETVKHWATTADTKVDFPQLTVKEGYTLNGWQVTGKEVTELVATATSLDHLDTLANYIDDIGYIAITPILVKEGETPEGTTYTVTFDSQGGSKVVSQTVKENATAAKPSNPSRSGYTFAGWYTEATCKNAYDFSAPVTKDITLYAAWNRNSSGGGSIHENETVYLIVATASGSGKISPAGENYVGTGYDKTFTMTPNRGYEIVKLVVDGDEVRIKDEYTFEKVNKDHTIHVVFAKDSEKVESPDNTGVSDSLNTKDHMQYLYGYPDDTFRANQNMTRAEAAQMFFNLLNNKDVKITVHFSDVKNNQWYAQAVNTMATLGIVTGYPDGTFQPNGNITRAEFTTMAMRFGKLDTNGKNIFSDVQSSDWFYHEVVGSSQYGWINGYPDGTFKPNATITRAEVTSMVNNMLGRFADKSYVDKNTSKLNAFTDLASGHWAYYDIREATNGHDYQKTNNQETWTKLMD